MAKPGGRGIELAGGRALESLQRVTDAALAYLSEEDLLQELLQRIADIMQIDTVAILLLEGETLHARAAKGIEEEVEQDVRIPIGRGFAGRIAAERRPITIPDVDHADILNPILREKGIKSLLGVPLIVQGRVLGVLHVGSLTPREFSDQDRDLLQLAGDRAALAIEQARLYEQRRVAETMQRRLLPAELPGVSSLEVAARYLPASGGSLGGDWYDVFLLTGGRVAVAVGDVVGRGVEAAAVMAQLRTGVRACVRGGRPSRGHRPRSGQQPDVAPRPAGHDHGGLRDPGRGEGNARARQRRASAPAGHPALRRRGVPRDAAGAPARDKRVVHLPVADGPPAHRLDPAALHRRSRGAPGESIDLGLERLRVLGEGFDDVEALCVSIVERLVAEEPSDDVAFIAARVPPLTDHLRTRWPASADSLAGIRYLLRRWLGSRGATAEETYDIIVACQEACANAVEHAYGPGRAEFELDALYAGGRVCLTVSDRGRWRPSRGNNRGRGLPMMRALVDTVDIRHGADGTDVVLAKRLATATT